MAVDIPDHEDCSIGVGVTLLRVGVKSPVFLRSGKLFSVAGPFREDRNASGGKMAIRIGQQVGKRRKRARRQHIGIQRIERFDTVAAHSDWQSKRLCCLPQERRFPQIRFDKRDVQIGLQLSCKNRNDNAGKTAA